MNECGQKQDAVEKYEGILHAMQGFYAPAGQVASEHAINLSIAYLASQVEMAQLPEEAKRPFYAAIEADYRSRAKTENDEGLAKLADFYANKIKQPES